MNPTWLLLIVFGLLVCVSCGLYIPHDLQDIYMNNYEKRSQFNFPSLRPEKREFNTDDLTLRFGSATSFHPEDLALRFGRK
uniref:Uncharacterized protein n=1 Tax=Heterorhabditis bacteriophora TaxID=37862 RepID=A0A1I7XH00_HETBA